MGNWSRTPNSLSAFIATPTLARASCISMSVAEANSVKSRSWCLWNFWVIVRLLWAWRERGMGRLLSDSFPADGGATAELIW